MTLYEILFLAVLLRRKLHCPHESSFTLWVSFAFVGLFVCFCSCIRITFVFSPSHYEPYSNTI